MRLAGIFALVFTAGCSLVWSMDKYEGGEAAARDDGGASSSSGGSSGASSSGASSSGASSSGASSGASSSGAIGSDGGGDAGKDAETCIDEPEPNGTGFPDQEIPIGVTCGAIITEQDIDDYKVTTAGTVTLTFEIGPGIQVIINPQGSGGSDIFHAPGSYPKSFDAGTHSVIFQTYTSTGAYKIRR